MVILQRLMRIISLTTLIALLITLFLYIGLTNYLTDNLEMCIVTNERLIELLKESRDEIERQKKEGNGCLVRHRRYHYNIPILPL